VDKKKVRPTNSRLSRPQKSIKYLNLQKSNLDDEAKKKNKEILKKNFENIKERMDTKIVNRIDL